MAGLFQVLYGNEDGTFRQAEELKGTDGEPLIITAADSEQITERICTRPFAVDWDADGDLDLIVGNFTGTFYWFPGQGKGEFAPQPEPILSGGSSLRIRGAHSDPFVIDWDADGDLDLLSGSSNGGVYWAENTASSGELPDLGSFQTLVEPEPQAKRFERVQTLREEDLTGPAGATRIWVDDVNDDGKLDLLVGDSVTLISPAEGLTDEDLPEKYAQWEKTFQAVLEVLNSAESEEDREKAYQEYNEVYRLRSKFMTEDMTGFVWVYLQK